jgi:hypothetical protein
MIDAYERLIGKPQLMRRPIEDLGVNGRILNGSKRNTRVYPKVSGLAAWSENRKWYSCISLT